MKKLVLLFMSLFMVTITSINVYAIDPDSYGDDPTTITEEKTTLLADEIIYNDVIVTNPTSISLDMFTSKLNIDVSSAYDRFDLYDQNINSISEKYILITVKYLYDTVWASSWGSLDDNFSIVSEKNLSYGYYYDILKYEFDSDEFEFTFNPTNQGALTILTKVPCIISKIQLVVEYSAPISNVIECGMNYALLSDLGSGYESINYLELITGDVYKFGYYDTDQQLNYRFLMIMPEFVDEDFEITDFMVQTDEINKLVYYEKDDSVYQLDVIESVYNEYNHLKTVGFTKKGDLSVAELYMFLPKSSDYLMSLDTTYSYRIKDFFTGYGDWVNVSQSYYALDQENTDWFGVSQTEIDPPRYTLLALVIPYFIGDWSDIYNEDTISQVAFNNLPLDIKSKYLEYFESDPNEFENYEYYKINLGQFRTVTSVGFDIIDMTIINLTYLENGNLISVPQDFIDQTIDDYIETNPDWSELPEHLLSSELVQSFMDDISLTMQIVFGSVAFLLIVIVISKVGSLFGNKNNKHYRVKRRKKRYKR